MNVCIFEIMNLKKYIPFTILTFFLILLILFIHGGKVFAQTPSMDCEGTIRAWKLSHPQLNCNCINGRPTCDQQSSSSGGGSVGVSQQMAAQIVLQGIMQGLFSVDKAREQEREIEQRMQMIKDERERAIARQKEWEKLRGELIGYKPSEPKLIGGNSNKPEPTKTGATFKSRGNRTEIGPASVTITTEQLTLSNQLGQKAVQMALTGDPGDLESARYLAEQSAQAMTGSVTKSSITNSNITLPEIRPVPASPVNIQSQKKILKETHNAIDSLTQNPSNGQAIATLNQIKNQYSKVQSNQLASLPSSVPHPQPWTLEQCKVAQRRVAAYRDALQQTVDVAERFNRSIAADQALRAEWEKKMNAASERAKKRGQFLWLAIPLKELELLNDAAADGLKKNGADLADLLAGTTEPETRNNIRIARQYLAEEKEVVKKLGENYKNIKEAQTLGENALLVFDDPEESTTWPFKGKNSMKWREVIDIANGLFVKRAKAPWAKFVTGGLSTVLETEAAARAMFDSWYDAFDAWLAWKQLYNMNLNPDSYLQAVQKLAVEMRKRSDRLNMAEKEFAAKCSKH